MSDPALLVLHAYEMLAHGGQLTEDCERCSEIKMVAEATALTLEAEPPVRPQPVGPDPTIVQKR